MPQCVRSRWNSWDAERSWDDVIARRHFLSIGFHRCLRWHLRPRRDGLFSVGKFDAQPRMASTQRLAAHFASVSRQRAIAPHARAVPSLSRKAFCFLFILRIRHWQMVCSRVDVFQFARNSSSRLLDETPELRVSFDIFVAVRNHRTVPLLYASYCNCFYNLHWDFELNSLSRAVMETPECRVSFASIVAL